jgi:transposase
VNEVLAALAGEFSALYSPIGRPSIPPEKLLRAMLLQGFYSIRFGRQLMELCSWGNALMENRNGLLVDACLTPADGHAERVRSAAHDRAARRSAAGDHSEIGRFV